MVAWKRLLVFEKSNPQRIDIALANKRISFTFEQCLMYLYHYPDIWYDYAMWHASTGSVDAAVKVFQRALKVLPDSDLLKYAYAELEESRGAIQSTKKIYESHLANTVTAKSLAHIQFIRFLRRTEGIEACSQVLLGCSKAAHNIFEAGMTRFINEPAFILKYADFLCQLNDDRNTRALFERAWSSLPAEKSVEVWKQFSRFEQTYGDLASMMKGKKMRKRQGKFIKLEM